LSSLGHFEEATDFSALVTFALMVYEEWNDVLIQIDATCIKGNNV